MEQDPNLTYPSSNAYIFFILWQFVTLGNHCIWSNERVYL